MDKEKFVKTYGMDYEDLISLVRKEIEGFEVDEYGYPVYSYYGCGEGYVVASKYEKGVFKFMKMPFEMEGEIPKINFESKTEVYPKIEYVEVGEKSEGSEIAENMGSMYSVLTTTIQEKNEVIKDKDEKILKFSEVDAKLIEKDEEIKILTEKNDELVKYQLEKVKEEKIEQANELYEKYSEYLSDEDKKELDKVLFEKDFEAFSLTVSAKVLPLVEASIEKKLAEVVDNPEASLMEKSINSELNFSATPIIENVNKPKSLKERLDLI